MGGSREDAGEGEAIGEDAETAFGSHSPEKVKYGLGTIGADLRVRIDEGVPRDDVLAGADGLEGRCGLRELGALSVHDHDAVAEEYVGRDA